jgi:hypothetical protein
VGTALNVGPLSHGGWQAPADVWQLDCDLRLKIKKEFLDQPQMEA